MRKSYKYRIYPSKAQEKILNEQLETCRKLYNTLLSERKEAWEKSKQAITMYEQHNRITVLKTSWLDLKEVHSQVLQDIATRIDLAFKSFFRRLKNKKTNEGVLRQFFATAQSSATVGYPRFKSKGRYDSITYKQYSNGVKILDDNRNGKINLSKIGHVKTTFHRKVEGNIKTAIITKSSTNKWYVVFSSEVEIKELPKSNENIGIDVGLETFAYMSNDTKIDNPRFFKKEEINLIRIQKKFDKVTNKDENGKVLNGSDSKRIKAKKVLSRTHERIKFKRDNFAHQESRKIINKYQIICIEDLEINKLKEHSYKCIRKSISDASWSLFFNMLNTKAEEAGRLVIKVNPAYTSQDCSQCGHREKKTLATRIHDCSCCGLSINRDLNASINILRIGLDSLGKNANSKSLEANDL